MTRPPVTGPAGTGPGVDAFTVLGIPDDPEVTDGQVRHAYQRRLRAVHPDAGGDSECAAAVTAAYDLLRSPGRRAAAAEAVLLTADSSAVTGPAAAVTSAAVLERIEDLTAALAPRPPEAVAAGPASAPMPPAAHAARPPRPAAGPDVLIARVRHGRWWLLATRAAAAVLVPFAGWLAAPGYPAAWAALAAGSATWLLRTGRYDLAPGPPDGKRR